MPLKSAKQYKMMAMIAHGGKSKKGGIGPSPEVAEEMIHKTPAKKRSLFMKKKSSMSKRRKMDSDHDYD